MDCRYNSTEAKPGMIARSFLFKSSIVTNALSGSRVNCRLFSVTIKEDDKKKKFGWDAFIANKIEQVFVATDAIVSDVKVCDDSNYNDSTKLQSLRNVLGVDLDSHPLTKALIHSSVMKHRRENQFDRREWLGDSVLQLIISDEIYSKHPNCNEGLLTKYRVKHINRNKQAEVARSIQLGSYLKVVDSVNTSSINVLSDGLESIIGTVFKEKGYIETRDMVLRLYSNHWDDIDTITAKQKKKKAHQQQHASINKTGTAGTVATSKQITASHSTNSMDTTRATNTSSSTNSSSSTGGSKKAYTWTIKS